MCVSWTTSKRNTHWLMSQGQYRTSTGWSNSKKDWTAFSTSGEPNIELLKLLAASSKFEVSTCLMMHDYLQLSLSGKNI